MTGLAQETVDKLLDFNQKLDIALLDNVVGAMYSSTGQEQKMAQEVLTTLKEHLLAQQLEDHHVVLAQRFVRLRGPDDVRDKTLPILWPLPEYEQG